MTASKSTAAVICGAGIAGVSAAYHLAKGGLTEVMLVDRLPPLSLTSDKSTECYRNWWPGPDDAMVGLMNHSIDRMEALALDTGNLIRLNRRGYLYVSRDPGKIPGLQAQAEAISRLGAGPLRIHTSARQAGYTPAPPEEWQHQPDGADLLLDPALIQQDFPFLTPDTVAALHVRRAGWFSAQQLGAYLLEEARRLGVKLVQGAVAAVGEDGGRVTEVRLEDGTRISTPIFINAAGPYLQLTSRLLGLDLPVYCEPHQKAALREEAGVLPRSAPLMIGLDAQFLDWSLEEREMLAEEEETRRLLAEFPPGVHSRPEGGEGSPIILLLWEYDSHPAEPRWPIPADPTYTEVCLRGLAHFIPGMRRYLARPPRPVLDGGYYTKTRENRPLIGPLPVEGAFVSGAFGGFGLMAACGAGELLADWVLGRALPGYAPAFSPDRYSRLGYQAILQGWEDTGQL